MLHEKVPQARIFTYNWSSGSLDNVAEDDLCGHADVLLNELAKRVCHLLYIRRLNDERSRLTVAALSRPLPDRDRFLIWRLATGQSILVHNLNPFLFY